MATVIKNEFDMYGSYLFLDTLPGIERDIKMNPFIYTTKRVVKPYIYTALSTEELGRDLHVSLMHLHNLIT